VVYGYTVAQAVCWAILVGLPLLTLWAVVHYGRKLLNHRAAVGIATELGAEGRDARDVFALMPIDARRRKQGLAAWRYLIDPEPGDELSESDARARLAALGIPAPVPASGPVPAPGAPTP
jgi:hypothetical protein